MSFFVCSWGSLVSFPDVLFCCSFLLFFSHPVRFFLPALPLESSAMADSYVWVSAYFPHPFRSKQGGTSVLVEGTPGKRRCVESWRLPASRLCP